MWRGNIELEVILFLGFCFFVFWSERERIFEFGLRGIKYSGKIWLN